MYFNSYKRWTHSLLYKLILFINLRASQLSFGLNIYVMVSALLGALWASKLSDPRCISYYLECKIKGVNENAISWEIY